MSSDFGFFIVYGSGKKGYLNNSDKFELLTLNSKWSFSDIPTCLPQAGFSGLGT
ncbi:MAG: hypothetical protein R6W68_02080 [Ignavibacteriaceae bacterium]